MTPLVAQTRIETPTTVSTGFPVIEIFGPTLQGEGPDAGRPAYFVRFGGCDFRCRWCDSMHAVDPEQVRARARRLTPGDIVAELRSLEPGPDLVVLSGGNPALLELESLVSELHSRRLAVAVETQGSRWKPWLATVDRLVVSPKGPSSGMDGPSRRAELGRFLKGADGSGGAPVLKVVIFDEDDLGYARWLAESWPNLPLYLSTGSDVVAVGLRGRARGRRPAGGVVLRVAGVEQVPRRGAAAR
jgi:7-carboxy-7-deazaguanine synthase